MKPKCADPTCTRSARTRSPFCTVCGQRRNQAVRKARSMRPCVRCQTVTDVTRSIYCVGCRKDLQRLRKHAALLARGVNPRYAPSRETRSVEKKLARMAAARKAARSQCGWLGVVKNEGPAATGPMR